MTDTKDTAESAPSATPPETEPAATEPAAKTEPTEPAATEPTEPAAKTEPAKTGTTAPSSRPIDAIRSRIGVVVVVALMAVGVYWSRVGRLPFDPRGSKVRSKPGPR